MACSRLLLATIVLLVTWLHWTNATTNYCPTFDKHDELPDLIFLAAPNARCISGTYDGSECDIFLRMATNLYNESFVDFYLEGSLKGWVAVGFSSDKNMVLTDVVGCKQARDGSLGVVNSWNPDISPQKNVIDPSQDYMCNYSVKFEDGRLKCRFSRYYGIINEGYDYDLNGSYYLILGHSDNQSPLNEALPFHSVPPIVSLSKFDVYNYNSNTSNGSSSGLPTWNIILKKAHGAIMLIAWSVLASTGVFISSWMRPALVNGRWFLLHRGLMITSLPTVLIALVCIFVSNKDNGTIIGFDCTLQTAHFSLGIIATLLMLINPILALFRCKPDSSNRWIFNFIHGPIGGLAVILGHFAIGTGLEFYETGCNNECSTKQALVFFVYVFWQLGFVTLFQVALNIIFSVIAYRSKGKERFLLAPSFVKPCVSISKSNEYEPINNHHQVIKQDDTNDTNKPSKDYKLRLVLFGIYTVVNCAVVLGLIVMLALKSPCGA